LVNSKGINQHKRSVVAEYFDKKGHPLQSVWFRKHGNENSLKMIKEVLFCPKCNIFFRITVDKIEVVIR